MGGSSGGKVLNAIRGPQTAGGPTPTLTQAQPFYPSYQSYSPQSAPNNIGLSIPTDINSLRQAAANQPAPMLVNRAAYNPAAYAPIRPAQMFRANPVETGFYNPTRNYAPPASYANAMAPTYAPQVTLNPVNPDPNANKPAVNVDQQRIDAERAYQEALANGGGGGSGWSSK